MKVRAVITTRWGQRGYVPVETDQVEAYAIDSAMDTDADTWTFQLGDPDREFIDVLRRDNEVRVNIFGLGNGFVETLHTGFADEITMDERNVLVFTGRDISSVAADSQHPPQIWRQPRPEVLVAKEARQLKIGDRLKLTPIRGFKTYATDGGESYWQVWYRFYRKRRMWLWAEPDGSLNASTLHYNAQPAYYFGAARGTKGSGNPGPDQWIPVERLEIRANKSQRVGEVFIFGHRGDVGFVARAKDPSTLQWIKRPNMIRSSGDVHNAAEARVEAWEEIFESKVGALEIKLLIPDINVIVRQNSMAVVNIPQVGLTGEYFVVGTNIVGSITEGFFQQVRLREKNLAISRRVPDSPQLKGNVSSSSTSGGVAENLSADIPASWKRWFVEAAQTYRGPWPFELFLGVLLSISEQEGMRNVREGGNIVYPGTKNGEIPSMVTNPAEFNKFATTFANEPSQGRVRVEYGVGPMQLTTPAYKHAADRLSGGQVPDELAGGRWNEEFNIKTGAAVLASKLGAGWSITSDGRIVKTPVTGLSLQPIESNIWAGVQAYNGSGDAAVAYMKSVKERYTNTYKAEVAEATLQTKQDQKNQKLAVPSASSAELRKRVLNNNMITYTRRTQSSDIAFGMVHDEVLIFMLAFTDAGFPIVVTAMRSDHDKYTTGGNLSAHGYGLAIDMGNYNLSNPLTKRAMEWIGQYYSQLGISQLIGPVDSLVIPPAHYDAQTLREHDTHIHVGWPLELRNS